MHRFISIIILLLFSSCASGPVNKVRQKEIELTGGIFERKSWDDTLSFKRTSWYVGASLSYDIWLARIDKNSPFTYWMENNKEQYGSCREFYVGLIYSNSASNLVDLESPASLKKQFADLGFEVVSLSQFRSHLAAHTVFQQWHLRNHRITGFCFKKPSSIPKEIPIFLPGFKTINILDN